MNNYQTIAEDQAEQLLGTTGSQGDLLTRLVIVPASTSPGEVVIFDGDTQSQVFEGGTDSVADIKPIDVAINAYSVSGPWKITTGSGVSVIALGEFT